MLSKLNISNYAIIEQAEIDFSASLNIITGETGAGKSILLGALGLLLGGRADTKSIFKQQGKCIIEGTFRLAGYNLKDFFDSADIDYADETIVRREISDNGKSRAFINDTPVNLSVLNQLADNLVQIHSQHETLALADSRFQLMVIDSLAGTQELLKTYQHTYQEWNKTARILEETIAASALAEKERDYIAFQLNELNAADLVNIHQENLESELQQLTHAEEIKRSIFESIGLLRENELNGIDIIRQTVQQLESIRNFYSNADIYIERLESSRIELQDIATDLAQKIDQIQIDPESLEIVKGKLDILYRLQKKHGVATAAELLEIQQQLETQMGLITHAADTIEQLQKQVNEFKLSAQKQAGEISRLRTKIFSGFEKNVIQLLQEVGMKSSVLKVENTFDQNNLTTSGGDTIQFTFSANPGSPLQDIKKVASGGELSRLMLCIKSLVAGNTALPTLIFDEIDSGVSGETAQKVGIVLEKLSRNHQVIAITHLPQIAAKGKHHLFVFKRTFKNHTETNIRILNTEERITEIAHMLSGENPSEAAIINAKELMHAAK